MKLIVTVNEWIDNSMHDTWVWFTRLNQEEWMAILAIGAGLGFFCMRGRSSKRSI